LTGRLRAAALGTASARDALTAIRPKLDKSALLHWIAVWILLAIEDKVRLGPHWRAGCAASPLTAHG